MTNEPYLVTTRRHMSAVIELHALSFNLAEQTKLTHALLDKSHFSLLIGDKEPVGYMVFVIQGKEATGLWAGVKPEHRGEGLYRKMQLAGLNECRVRGAETYNGYVSKARKTTAINVMMQIALAQTEYYSNIGQYFATTSTCDASTSGSIENILFDGGDIISDESGYQMCITLTPENSSYEITAYSLTDKCTLKMSGISGQPEEDSC